MSNNTNKNNTKNQNERSSRDSRVDSRDSSLEIVMPDGRKFMRRPTENLGSVGYRLAAPEKAGFYRHWFSDEIDGKIQKYLDLGFVPASDELGQLIQPRRGGNKKNGQEYKMYLLEIPTEELERLKAKNKESDPSARASENQKRWLEGQQSNDSELQTYALQSDGKNYNSEKLLTK